MNISEIKKKFDQKLTLIIIPHSGEETKQFKLHKAIVSIALIFFIFSSIFFITSTFFLLNQKNNLIEELQIKDCDIQGLNSIVEHQDIEIDELKRTTQIVRNKLNQLYELENKIRNMIGLKPSSTSDVPVTSRSINNFTNILSDKELTNLENNDSVDAITSLIDSEKEKYDEFIKEVEKQLKYLEALPNKWPVDGTITSKFGYRVNPISKRRQFHKGLDIANKSGTNIIAAGSGIVTFSGCNGGYGNVIIISHGYGYKSVYGHNKKNLVKVGNKVKKGQVIAKLGNTGKSTGPHVHFEIHYQAKQIDPLRILKKNEK